MGGSVAVELARRVPERVRSLLLLAPAGLSGRRMPVPPLLDRFGAWFLSRPGVRRGLCRQAFADPDSSVGARKNKLRHSIFNVPAGPKLWQPLPAAVASLAVGRPYRLNHSM